MPSVRAMFKSRRGGHESPTEELSSRYPTKQQESPPTPPLSPDPAGSNGSGSFDEESDAPESPPKSSSGRSNRRLDPEEKFQSPDPIPSLSHQKEPPEEPSSTSKRGFSFKRDLPKHPNSPSKRNLDKKQLEDIRQAEKHEKQQKQENHPPKSSFSLLKRGKNATVKSNEGVPIITASGSDFFSPSLVQSDHALKGPNAKKEPERPKIRPTAKNAAFMGPVRYDWMDIETAAAIKVQAAYRRCLVLNDLDERGLSTPGMRNRRRQRNAKNRMLHSEDVPFPFSLCGVGFLFGDGTLEDERVTAAMEKKKVEKKKHQLELEDARRRRFHFRKKESQHLEEGIEVVESFEEPEFEPEDSGEKKKEEEEEEEELPPPPAQEEEKSPRWRRSLSRSRKSQRSQRN